MTQYDGVSIMKQPAYNIFNSLSAWGKTLPGWQHFLLSKLVATDELLDETINEVFAEYLIDQHLAGPDAAPQGGERHPRPASGLSKRKAGTLDHPTSLHDH